MDAFYVYEADAGEVFANFIKRVQKSMKKLNQKEVVCVFNDIKMFVHIDSRVQDISTIHDLKRELAWHKGW